MKKIILAILCTLGACLIHLHPVYSQSENIHFTGVGAKTNSYVGCNPHGSGFFDYNGDNLPDIFVVSNISEGGWKDKKVPHTLLKNMGNGTFTNVTGHAGVGGYLTSAQGFAAADYDNDGYRDLAIGYGVSWYTLLYKQTEPGVFTNYTGTAGLSDWDYRNRGRNITFVDYDNDGLLDFFSFGDDTYSEYSLLVYKNIGNARFVVQTKQAGLDHDRSTTDFWGFAFADIDNDGDMDFFSANNGSVCHLFINKGNGTFKDETTERGIVKQSKFYGAIFLDYNNDGWFDLYTRRDKSKSILYKNNKDGTFSDVTLGSGLRETLARPPYGGGLSVADFNNDGYIDILAISIKGTDFRLYQNNGNGTFTNVAGSANILKYTNFNYTAPIADYNGDGYLDIYLARCDSYPPDYFATLFENDGGSNHWLHVKLIGVQTNRDAIGARAVAYTNGELQMRQVLGGDCYKMDSLPVEFGVGGNSVVDSLIIYWPSGIVQREMLIPADTLITITEEKRIYYHSHLISGQINYYKQNKKVPSVTLQMSGTSSTTTYSNQIGLYKFPVTTGYNNLDVVPSKTPDTDIGECTISAYDAGLAAQAAEDIKPLTGFAAEAADINQNTIIDALDPILIARKAVGFANSEGSQAGRWKFDPLAIHIESLVQSDLNDQNFTAWIIGDVDGSWTQSGSQEKEEVNDPAYDQVVLHDSTISINLTAPGSVTMQSADLWFEFDTSLFKFREIKTTSMTDGFEFVYNDATPGLMKIALFNSVPVWSYEEFLEIIFEVVPEVIDDTTHMHWILYRIDDKGFDKPDIDIDLRTFSVYGKIKYFQKNNVVPEVTLTLDGIIKDDQSFTNNNGNYQFVGIKANDNILVTPSKQKGENIGDLVISAYDAFLTARHAVNVEHLYGLTIQAADVDKNDKIEISDAEYIAKAAVGGSDSDISQVGEWEFSPPSYFYSNVTESREEDFTAYIMGDVNGDWLFNQSAPSYKLVKSKGQNKYTSELLVNGSYEFSIPLSLDQGDSLGSADIWGEFNASALELISIEKAEELTNFHLMYNDTIPGMFKIALFGTKYMKFEDTFITLHFRVITKQIEETTLNWKYFRINNKNYDEDNLIIDTGVNDYSYSGEVVYYQDSIGILDTKLQMLGTVNNQKFSDSEGNYTFTQVSRSDSIVVIPSKERNEDVGNFTISAYDAVLAARHAVGLDTLSGYSWEAADVDTNGIVDMLDAVFIAQQSVGITDSVSSLAGVWRFSPESRTCHYVSEDIQNADFTACILGDINGDWKPNGMTSKLMKMYPPTTLNIEEQDAFLLPLVLENDVPLASANIWLNYDQSVLELVDITKSPAFEKFHLFYNDLVPGEIKIALFGLEPVKGEQEFLTLHFNYVSQQQQDTKIHCEYWCINNIEYSKNDVIIQTGINDNIGTELDFKLRSNYPNPFNPETTINYQIEKNGQVRLVIYNSQGRIVHCLVDRYQNQGKYAVQWDGLDDSGEPVGSGLYFCRLSSGNKIQVIKMVKLK